MQAPSPPGVGGYIYLQPRVQKCACPCICGRNPPPQTHTLLGGDAYPFVYGGAMPRAPPVESPPPVVEQPFVKPKPKSRAKPVPEPEPETETETESEGGAFHTPPDRVDFESNYDRTYIEVPEGTEFCTVDFYGTFQNGAGRKWTSGLAWVTVAIRPGADPEPWKVWKNRCESTKEWIKPYGVRQQWDTILAKVKRVRRTKQRRVRHLGKDFTENTTHNMEACERCVSIDALCAHFTVDAGRK